MSSSAAIRRTVLTILDVECSFSQHLWRHEKHTTMDMHHFREGERGGGGKKRDESLTPAETGRQGESCRNTDKQEITVSQREKAKEWRAR